MYICIEGNIGSGKSTLAQALALALNAVFLPERFEENTLLPLFYKDPETFAFPTEYAFLIDRQKQLVQHFAQAPAITVADYMLTKCLYFAEVNLGETDFNFYQKHFAAIASTVPAPDLLIYIDAPEALLLDNIRKRGRSYEAGIDPAYLGRIGKVYAQGLKTLSCPVHTIRVERYDAESLNRYVEDICTLVKELR